jgi:hypothetical protein
MDVWVVRVSYTNGGGIILTILWEFGGRGTDKMNLQLDWWECFDFFGNHYCRSWNSDGLKIMRNSILFFTNVFTHQLEMALYAV